MISTKLRVKELLRERRWTTKVLAEKTGMSESYLTHIKNGTRRWNEDALRKLADAFELEPTDIFSQRSFRTDNVEKCLSVEEGEEKIGDNLKLKIVPVVGEIPSSPSPYNNQIAQATTGHKNSFVPLFGSEDDSMFCLEVEDSSMAPKFIKGDQLIISPAVWTRSGDVVAVEYGANKELKAVMQVNYMDDFVVLESVNHKKAPVALVRGKDNFRIIGKVIARYQKMS
jgi:SOS-response transcriptional repressor LexA